MNGDLLCLWFVLLTCTFRTISPSPHVCSTHTWLLAFISSSSLWIRFINFRIFTIYKTTNFSCLTAHRTIFLMFLSSGSNGEREHTHMWWIKWKRKKENDVLWTHTSHDLWIINSHIHTDSTHSWFCTYSPYGRAREQVSSAFIRLVPFSTTTY